MAIKADRKDKQFIGIVVLVHVLFFMLACHYTRIYMGDSMEYIYEALNIKNLFFFYSGNPAMPIVPEYMTQRQPLYPLFLMGVYLFTANNWVVLMLQNLLSVFNIYYARKVLLSIGYDKKCDWLLLLLVVGYPVQFINANTIAPDILLQTFTLLYFGCFIALRQRKELKYGVWMSLALICGFMVKPVLYPFVVIHAVVIIVVFARQRIKMQRPLLIALVPLFVVLLYSYSNYDRTEKFHFSSNQAQNAIYYYYSYLANKEGVDSANRFLHSEKRNIASLNEYKDRYDYANERGMTLLKDNFGGYLLYHLKNSARILIEPGKAEMDLFTGSLTYGRLYRKEQSGFYATIKNKGVSGIGEYFSNNPSMPFIILVLLFNCIRLIGIGLFFVDKRINGFVRLFVFILLAYFAGLAGPIANTRYFLPVSLIAIGCAVIGYTNRFQKRPLAN